MLLNVSHPTDELPGPGSRMTHCVPGTMKADSGVISLYRADFKRVILKTFFADSITLSVSCLLSAA